MDVEILKERCETLESADCENPNRQVFLKSIIQQGGKKWLLN